MIQDQPLRDDISTVRVLKLGGSLLITPDWPQRLQNWLLQHPAPLNFLLVGGGEIVESVRRLDTQHHFSVSFSHWLCIDLLSATARIAAQLLPEFPLVSTSEELSQIIRQHHRAESTIDSKTYTRSETNLNSVFVVDVASFYSRTSVQLNATASGRPSSVSSTHNNASSLSALDSMAFEKGLVVCSLPENWDTTSDSLAAWLTRVVGAQELVLFKSMTPVLVHNAPQDWVEQGIVDATFADTLPESVSVQIVNLVLWPD
ncbi:MAG: hypothetical protein ABI557_11350 [Aureliella sp.]